MTPEQTSRLRALINKRLTTLQGAEASKREYAKPVELDQTRVGRLSRQDALQSQALSTAALERNRSEVTRLKAALARIEQDEYGWCEDCGEEVAVARLEIDPAANFCVQCAKRREDR